MCGRPKSNRIGGKFSRIRRTRGTRSASTPSSSSSFSRTPWPPSTSTTSRPPSARNVLTGGAAPRSRCPPLLKLPARKRQRSCDSVAISNSSVCSHSFAAGFSYETNFLIATSEEHDNAFPPLRSIIPVLPSAVAVPIAVLTASTTDPVGWLLLGKENGFLGEKSEVVAFSARH